MSRSRSLRLVSLLALTACGSSSHATNGANATNDAGPPDGSITTTPTPSSDAGVDGAIDTDGAASDDAGPTDPGPFPLGATLGTNAIHFRVRADAATRVDVDLYTAATGVDEALALTMTRIAAGDPWGADIPYATLASAGLTAPPSL